MHFWLPGAMAAPTPVSAYLHAAAMVKAGVYLVARMSAGVRRFAAVAADRDHARRADHAAGRLARGARIRPQADPRVRHGQPARVDHRDGRRRRRRPDAGRAGHAVRARHVQGRAVHGRRRHRPRHRHPRHPQAGLARTPQPAAAVRHRRRRDREHGRTAPVPRLRRQGGRLRNRRCTARHSAPRRPMCSPASCSGRCSPPSTACGSCGERSAARDDRSPARGLPKCTAPRHVPRPPRRSWPPRAGVRPVAARGWTTHSTPTPTRCPAARTTTSRCGTGFGLPLLLSALVLAAGTAAYFVRGPAATAADRCAAAGQRRPDLRRGAAWRGPAVGAAHRGSPSAARSRRRSR